MASSAVQPSDNKLALRVVGGGDSAAAIAQAGLPDKASHCLDRRHLARIVQGLELPGSATLKP